MMEIIVAEGGIEKAIVDLKREAGKSGLNRELKLKAIAKASERKKAKQKLNARRLREAARRKDRIQKQGRPYNPDREAQRFAYQHREAQ